MKILQFDSTGGASGDMILACLIDLGADRDAIQAQVAAMSIGHFEIHADPVTENGMRGTRVRVEIAEHSTGHDHGHAPHRGFNDIRTLIEASGLPQAVKQNSIGVFRRLAEAEAHVHRSTVDQVHFHEVGAVDSIVDIVGSCLAIHLLGVEAVAVGPLPAGYGTVSTAHGILPVPAPATVELLKGHAVVQTDEPYELVTPTGAALLTTWMAMAAPPAGSRLAAAGYGFGHRKLAHRPNLLRALLLDAPASEPGGDSCLVLECNLDDITPELIGALTQRLLASGAMDVFTTPVQMKKQRPGTLLTVLCHPAQRDALVDVLFRESTTFGVREHLTRRTVLERRHIEVRTPYGTVRVKVGRWQGEDVTRSPEYEDCIRCAEASKVPVRSVYEAAVAAARPAGPG